MTYEVNNGAILPYIDLQPPGCFVHPAAPIADEIVTFFGNGLPIATPTAFVVNVNTLKAYPLTQGVMDIPVLESRWASLIQADIDNVDPKTLPPMPASAQVTPQ